VPGRVQVQDLDQLDPLGADQRFSNPRFHQ
jgi:hypothetical protein